MNKSYFKKGFTLIELLVVVGILAVLAIAALIAINPLEAQRKSRDSARLQDMARLTSTMEAYINDNGFLNLATSAVNSGAAANAGVRSQSCDNNWIDVAAPMPNFCDYIKAIPLDPQNGRPITIANEPGLTPTRLGANGGYGFAIDITTGNYEFCTRIESDRNRALLDDNGNTNAVFETGVNTGLVTCTMP